MSTTSSRHCLSVLVSNEPGVLARVIGLFSGRGYNIESLSVAEVDHDKKVSRITIVTTGTQDIVEQIAAQLARLVPVLRVVNLTEKGAWIEREMALVKVAAEGNARAEVLRLATANYAQPVDAHASPLILKVMGAPHEIDRFLDQMRPLGLVEAARTGTVGLGTGAETL